MCRFQRLPVPACLWAVARLAYNISVRVALPVPVAGPLACLAVISAIL